MSNPTPASATINRRRRISRQSVLDQKTPSHRPASSEWRRTGSRSARLCGLPRAVVMCCSMVPLRLRKPPRDAAFKGEADQWQETSCNRLAAYRMRKLPSNSVPSGPVWRLPWMRLSSFSGSWCSLLPLAVPDHGVRPARVMGTIRHPRATAFRRGSRRLAGAY